MERGKKKRKEKKRERSDGGVERKVNMKKEERIGIGEFVHSAYTRTHLNTNTQSLSHTRTHTYIHTHAHTLTHAHTHVICTFSSVFSSRRHSVRDFSPQLQNVYYSTQLWN